MDSCVDSIFVKKDMGDGGGGGGVMIKQMNVK